MLRCVFRIHYSDHWHDKIKKLCSGFWCAEKIISDSVDKSHQPASGKEIIDELVYFTKFDKDGSVVMTLKTFKYDDIVLRLFEEVDDFININIEKRRRCGASRKRFRVATGKFKGFDIALCLIFLNDRRSQRFIRDTYLFALIIVSTEYRNQCYRSGFSYHAYHPTLFMLQALYRLKSEKNNTDKGLQEVVFKAYWIIRSDFENLGSSETRCVIFLFMKESTSCSFWVGRPRS